MLVKMVVTFLSGTILTGAGFSPVQTAPDPCFGRKPTILGTDSMDSIRGTAGDDVIFAGDGDDLIVGGEGKDRICAGRGDDEVDGGRGDDVIFGSVGADRLRGGDGDDRIFSGGTDPTEPEYLYGDNGDDVLRGESTPEVIHGGLGRDNIQGGSSLLEIPDQLYGDEDDDRIFGEAAFLHGGQGDDYLAEGGIVDFSDVPGPVTVDLGRQYAVGEGNDALVDVAGVRGSAFDDVLIGNHRDNWLMGGEGDDLLDGRDGRDAHDGGMGEDSCVRGHDTFSSCEHLGDRSALGLRAGASGAQPRLSLRGSSVNAQWIVVVIVLGALLLLSITSLGMYRLGFRKGRTVSR